jgi:diguanylate cyclase (GGDEF)-like protein
VKDSDKLTALYEVTREIELSDDPERLLDRVLEKARELIGFEHCALLLYDPGSEELVLRQVSGEGRWREGVEGFRLPADQGLSGWAVRHRQAVRVGDVSSDPRYVVGLEGARSNLVVPLIVGNEVAGVLDVESRRPDAFTEEHEQLLTVLGVQAALAIEASRTTDHLRSRLRELDALHRISRLAASGRPLDWILDQMLAVAQGVSPESQCAILLLDDSGKRLRIRAARGYAVGSEGLEISLDDGVTGRCAQSGAPVRVDDVAEEPAYIRGVEGARSEVAVPMAVEGEVIGVLNAESGLPAAFDDGLVGLLALIAEQAAVVIRTARLQEETALLACTDPLTGLFNRRRFLEELGRALHRGERYGDHFALLFLDLDRFKAINDRHGHEAGDRALQAVASALTAGLRQSDVLGRLGGEELAALLMQVDRGRATRVAERLRAAIGALELPLENDAVLRLTVSGGLALYPEHGGTPDALLRAADAALYAAKDAGRDRVCCA